MDNQDINISDEQTVKLIQFQVSNNKFYIGNWKSKYKIVVI